MTGAYLRVLRGGQWQPIEVEHLTDDERAALFNERESVELVRWLNLVCNTLQPYARVVDAREAPQGGEYP